MVDGTELDDHVGSCAALEVFDGLIKHVSIGVIEDVIKHEETGSGGRRGRRERGVRVDRKIKVERQMDIDALFHIEMFLLEDELSRDPVLGNRKTRPTVMDDKVSVPVGSSDLVNAATPKRCVCKN